ncbi:MAG TPA: hypothetical protein VHL09_08055 [Dehalococcoidia bacterium]|nr:hypothetical protein [Dehalococcoidia bacterium]
MYTVINDRDSGRLIFVGQWELVTEGQIITVDQASYCVHLALVTMNLRGGQIQEVTVAIVGGQR